MVKNTRQLKIDHAKKTIIMGCAFAKKQANTDSKEYAELLEVHREFPNYKIKTKVVKKREDKESYKGLTYSYMKEYISLYGCAEDMNKYEYLLMLAQCHSVRYPTIKAWFLEKYPDVKNFGVQEELCPSLPLAS